MKINFKKNIKSLDRINNNRSFLPKLNYISINNSEKVNLLDNKNIQNWKLSKNKILYQKNNDINNDQKSMFLKFFKEINEEIELNVFKKLKKFKKEYYQNNDNDLGSKISALLNLKKDIQNKNRFKLYKENFNYDKIDRQYKKNSDLIFDKLKKKIKNFFNDKITKKKINLKKIPLKKNKWPENILKVKRKYISHDKNRDIKKFLNNMDSLYKKQIVKLSKNKIIKFEDDDLQKKKIYYLNQYIKKRNKNKPSIKSINDKNNNTLILKQCYC